MATKQALKSSTYKIPPKEMIVTRNKSARMRQQMNEEKNTKPKMVSNSKSLLKKALKNISQPKKKKVVKIVEDTDYYPNLKKRDVVKKMFMKPKDKFKMIGDVKSVNKRKLCIPQKFKSPKPTAINIMTPDTTLLNAANKTDLKNKSKPQQPVYSELSMDEVFRFSEDTQSLTEEDFMEILTCPSPVWWEDPPDASYIEGAIFSRTPPPEPAIAKNNKTEQKHVNDSIVEITKKPKNFYKPLKIINALKKSEVAKVKKLDEQFLKKNTKLENILGSVKNRLSNKNSKLNLSNRLKKQRHSSECNKGSVSTHDVRKNYSNKLELTTINVNLYNNNGESCNNSLEKNSISTDTDELSDTSLNDIELLKHLEKVDIPIEENDSVKNSDLNTSDSGSHNTNNPLINTNENVDLETLIESTIVKKTMDNHKEQIVTYKVNLENEKLYENTHNFNNEVLDKSVNIDNCKTSADIKKDDHVKKNNTVQRTGSLTKIAKKKKMLKNNKIMHNLTVGQISEIRKKIYVAKKVSANSVYNNQLIFKSTNKKLGKKKAIETAKNRRNNIKHKITKTIKPDVDPSDFIEITHAKAEGTESEVNDIQKSTDINMQSTEQADINDKGCDKNGSEINTNKQIEINSFYKKCKNAHKNKTKNDESSIEENPTDYCKSCDPIEKKMIVVSHRKSVKYCMKCSSLFDKDECMYCIKKNIAMKQ